ncbi:hypothetical protein [Rhodococcus qingshengii]|uniref:hypothetical protein n=1 Tax=Rhodococcus qingshengii TaxID=334542 RepID=UPI001C5F82F5|nr:hypothetical protein [Rhodococcus qingshengii]MBW4818408.1 hypothetical protein [Rhodococcus qingshengii]
MPTLLIDAFVATLGLLRPRRLARIPQDIVRDIALALGQARWARLCVEEPAKRPA